MLKAYVYRVNSGSHLSTDCKIILSALQCKHISSSFSPWIHICPTSETALKQALSCKAVKCHYPAGPVLQGVLFYLTLHPWPTQPTHQYSVHLAKSFLLSSFLPAKLRIVYEWMYCYHSPPPPRPSCSTEMYQPLHTFSFFSPVFLASTLLHCILPQSIKTVTFLE